MERNFTPGDFEEFIQDNADDLKMHPSPKVWEEISRKLVRKRRTVRFGFLSFMIAGSLLAYFGLDRAAQTGDASLTGYRHTLPSEITHASSGEPETPAEEPGGRNTEVASRRNPSNPIRMVPIRGGIATPSLAETERTTAAAIPEESLTDSSLLIPPAETLPEPPATTDAEVPVTGSENSGTTETASTPLAEEDAPTDSNPAEVPNVALIQSKKAKRLTWQIQFTPTVSYRKLSENKPYLRDVPQFNAPVGVAPLYDINNAVTHKPDIGLELGIAAKYALSDKFRLRGGVQFNVNRYDIKAFTYVPEVATIALNSRRNRADSVNTVTNYRNFGGTRSDWLQNFYFQISAPIGFEMKLYGDEKVQFGIASTLQPTYVLGDRAYVISSDYKNYAEVPWLIRRWNVNTNLETFVSYSTGRLQWQVGPQMRYQILSSFKKEYPVKEHLFDFGLKVGISLSNNP